MWGWERETKLRKFWREGCPFFYRHHHLFLAISPHLSFHFQDIFLPYENRDRQEGLLSSPLLYSTNLHFDRTTSSLSSSLLIYILIKMRVEMMKWDECKTPFSPFVRCLVLLLISPFLIFPSSFMKTHLISFESLDNELFFPPLCQTLCENLEFLRVSIKLVV